MVYWSFILSTDVIGLFLSFFFSWIALFTVSFSHLHYNTIQHVHVCEAISGYFVVLTQNCLASTLDYIVMQMRKTNREKGYCKVPHLPSWIMNPFNFSLMRSILTLGPLLHPLFINSFYPYDDLFSLVHSSFFCKLHDVKLLLTYISYMYICLSLDPQSFKHSFQVISYYFI